jgi:signal peptidase I
MDAEPGQPDVTGASFAETADISPDAVAAVAQGTAGNGTATSDGAGNGSAGKVPRDSAVVPRDGAVRDDPQRDAAEKDSAAGDGAAGSGADGNRCDGADGAAAGGKRPEKDATAQDATADGGDADADAGDGVDKGKRKRSFGRELGIVVIAALVLTILIKAFLVQVFSIPSASMQNTLQPGDRILVNRLVYHLRGIARGDIVVFSGDGSWGPPPPPAPGNPAQRVWDDFTNLVGISAPGTDYVKRVIGLPGDRVKCCDAQGRVAVNGVPLTEGSYLYPGDQPSQLRFNVVVPPGRLWVLGDHRSDSADSRYHSADGFDGTIPESEVVGRAFLIIWPASRFNDLPIPNTFQQAELNVGMAAINYGPAVGGGSAAAGVLIWRRRRLRRPTRNAA